jgi:hypothetical protein
MAEEKCLNCKYFELNTREYYKELLEMGGLCCFEPTPVRKIAGAFCSRWKSKRGGTDEKAFPFLFEGGRKQSDSWRYPCLEVVCNGVAFGEVNIYDDSHWSGDKERKKFFKGLIKRLEKEIERREKK